MTITYSCKRCDFEFEIEVTPFVRGTLHTPPEGGDYSPDFCARCSCEVDSELVADLAEAKAFDQRRFKR